MEAKLPLLVRDPCFRDHVPPAAHPECPERLIAVDGAVEALAHRFVTLAPRPANDEEILRGHGPAHLAGLRRIEGRSAQVDPDTYASAGSIRTARLAAGSTIDLALRVAQGDAPRGLALIRPPGHHAESNRAMGFCLLNQVALAAHALRARSDRGGAGLERIAIVDFDVHHGNGTQEIFESTRDVLYLSLHQYPFYPGTGALRERGQGAGEGATVNLPLPAGSGDAEYGAVFDALVVPVLRAFRPEFVLVSAGFDAHTRDPLGGMELSSAAFGRFASQLRTLADEICAGRIVFALEGGYDLEALGACTAAVAEALARPEPGSFFHPGAHEPAHERVEIYRSAHEKFWPCLQQVRS